MAARADFKKNMKISERIARTSEWIIKMANVNILHDSLTRCEANAVVRLSKFDLEVFLIIFSKKNPKFPTPQNSIFFYPLKIKISKNPEKKF